MKRFTALLLILTLLSFMATASAADTGYTDVPEGHWACSEIEKAGQYGLMQGLGNGVFGMGQALNRASFVTVLCRMLSWELLSPESASYSDVFPDQWFYSAVETALAHGALEQTALFRPEDPITREEMAIILVRALGYEQLALAGYDFSLPFSDVTENRGYIALAWQIGLTNGTLENGSLLFQPHESATREQAAAMLVRVYERCTAKIDWLHGFYAFSSYSQISLTDEMDHVSLGWARLEADENGAPWLNSTSANSNSWVVPKEPEAALNHFQASGTPYNLNVYSVSAALLADEDSRRSTAAVIADAAADYAGITMDFESLRLENRDNFTAFMTVLRALLPEEKSLYVCVSPAVPDDVYYDGYDYRALGELCDKVILMAHDYQYTSVPASYIGTGRTESPLTPFNKIYYALAAITDPQTGVADVSKITLAISFGSVGWHVDENGKLLETSSYNPAPSTIFTRLQQPDTVMAWSEVYRNASIYYTTENGSHYRLWYEDARSVTEKLQLAQMFGITGVSLWRLGNIPNYSGEALNYDVWGAVLADR